MKMQVEEVFFQSSNKVNKISGSVVTPIDIEIKGIIQVCHGMGEYFDKYKYFTKYFVEQGYIVCGYDQLGHGDSVDSEDNRGYFAPKDGYKYLIEDVNIFNNLIRERFKDLPLYLFAHSMGSFVSRCYAAKYGQNINGLILCGTIGPQTLTTPGIKLANFMASAKGDHYRSKKLYNLALDFANIKFFPPQTRFDWLCSDEEEVKRHVEDNKSGFVFTVSGFKDLFHLVNLCNSEKLIKTIPKDLPILFISGKDDPIGENGVGVRKAVRLHKASGIKNVVCKLYPNSRHELVNEKNKYEVYKDILSWIDGLDLEKIEEI